MVAVLLPSASVAADGLDVALGIGADPDLRPRRRDGEGLDASQRLVVVDERSVRVLVGEAVVRGEALDSGIMVADEIEAAVQDVDGCGQSGRRFYG
jgi:hypothetical protein